MQRQQHQRYAGFSLIELVIVVVIIGIIGAIAIPRMSRGAAGAADSAVVANLSVLRNALDLYAAEHLGKYPDSHETLADQLTKRTNIKGEVMTSEGDEENFVFGPYLRAVPPLPVGINAGATAITNNQGTDDAGWVYTVSSNKTRAEIRTNTVDTEVDEANVPYNTY